MTEYEKMLSGQLFDGSDKEIEAIRARSSIIQQKFNQSLVPSERETQLQELFNHIGDSVVMPPFHCEFGQTISIGESSFLNMNVTMLDGANITLGNNVLVGPSCQFYTASHSLDFASRRRWETYCKPIVVEDDVWIGGNVVINQGVTIGARSVIAAGSVVNRDIPADCLYGGSPAKLIRKLQ